MDWLTPTIAGASALGSAAIGGASTAVNNKNCSDVFYGFRHKNIINSLCLDGSVKIMGNE